MFLRATIRKKDGKEHRYFSVVENRRVVGLTAVQAVLRIEGSREAVKRGGEAAFDGREIPP